MSLLACPSCIDFRTKKDSECIRCSAAIFSELKTYSDFCDATAASLEGALAPWTRVTGFARFCAELEDVSNAFLSSLAALNRRGFLTAAFQNGVFDPTPPMVEQRQWVHGWLPKELGRVLSLVLQEKGGLGVHQITNPPQQEVEATSITFYKGVEDTWSSNQISFEDVLEDINPVIAEIVSADCIELSVWDPVIGRNTVLVPSIMNILKEYSSVLFSGGSLVRQVRPRFSEPDFSKPAVPKVSYRSQVATNPARVLRKAGRLIKDLIFSRHEIAEDWSLCFEDKPKGELVVGYRPGGDREVQIKKVKACLRAANLSIPPMRVEPFRATRGGNERRVTRSQTATLESKDDNMPNCSKPTKCISPSNRCRKHQEIVGGLGIIVPINRKETACQLGTIGIVITHKGTEGFLTAGHVVDYRDNPVYQGGRLIGRSHTISDFKNGTSDSAFVAFEDQVTGKKDTVLSGKQNELSITPIHPNDSIYTGTEVYMDGATRKNTRKGIIVATDATIRFVDGGTLSQQYLADYKSNKGDSGAPVYTQEQILIGLNVGEVRSKKDVTFDVTFDFHKNSYGIISKWSNIINELEIVNPI